ncbi:MAG: hypothetical protein ACFFD4_34235 [Candidatus Odinarchaeota archaeon]
MQGQRVLASYVIPVTTPRSASPAPCNCRVALNSSWVGTVCHAPKAGITLARRDCLTAVLPAP